MRIAYVAKLAHESFHEGIVDGVREESATEGTDVEVFYGKSQQDVAGQKQFIRQIVDSGRFAGVMISPNDSDSLISDVKKIDDRNIPFILIDTPLSDSAASRSLRHNCGFVGTNNVIAGQLAAKFVESKIRSGNVLLMRGNDKHQSDIDRENGFIEEIRHAPRLRLLPPLQGWWEEDTAFRVFSAFAEKPHPPIGAVFAYNDPMALGVARYFDEHSDAERPLIVGVDGVLVGQRGVLQNKLSATVVQSPGVMGKIGVKNLIACIRENRFENKSVLTPVTLLKSGVALETMGTP